MCKDSRNVEEGTEGINYIKMNKDKYDSNDRIDLGSQNLSDKALLNKNASITCMLPSLLKDLFYLDSNSNALLQYFDSQVPTESNETDGTFLELKSQVQALVHGKKISKDNLEAIMIDQNKTILLSFLLGSCYIEALEILSHKENINIEILCKEESEAQSLGEYYLNNYELPNDCKEEALFIKITQKKLNPDVKSLSKRDMAATRDKLRYLEIKSLLEKVGFSLSTNGTIFVPRTPIDPIVTLKESDLLREKIYSKLNLTFEENFVDLNNWYCSCEEYQNCYLHNEYNQIQEDTADITTAASAVMLTVDELIAESLDSNSRNSLIARLLQQCSTGILSPIPICPHILAMLILLYNKDVNPKYVISCNRIVN